MSIIVFTYSIWDKVFDIGYIVNFELPLIIYVLKSCEFQSDYHLIIVNRQISCEFYIWLTGVKLGNCTCPKISSTNNVKQNFLQESLVRRRLLEVHVLAGETGRECCGTADRLNSRQVGDNMWGNTRIGVVLLEPYTGWNV